MKICDVHTCEKCGRIIAWCYIVPNRVPNRVRDVDEIPTGMIGLRNPPYRLAHGRYIVSCYCDVCGKLNCFEYTTKIKLD